MTIVVFLQKDKLDIRHPKFIENKRAADIQANFLGAPENTFLGIKTPNYISVLDPNSVPSNDYPGLIQTQVADNAENQKNDFAFVFINNSDKNKIFFIFKVFDPTNDKIEFPSFSFGFDPENYRNNKKIDDFRFDMVDHFGFEIQNPQIFVNKTEVDYQSDAFHFIQSIFPCNNKKNSSVSVLEFRISLMESGLKTIRTRESILNELIDTERSYCFDLTIILNFFGKEIEQCPKILPNFEEDYETIFGPLPKMLICHTNFLNALIKNGTKYSSTVSRSFLMFAFSFHSTQQYIVNYNPKILSILQKIGNDNLKLRDICRRTPDNATANLSSYLIKPIQRMPRYPLLIRELIKNTPESHPDFNALQDAHFKIEETTHEMENASGKFQERDLVKSIQDRISNIKNKHKLQLVTKDRVLVMHFFVYFRVKNNKYGLYNNEIIDNENGKNSKEISNKEKDANSIKNHKKFEKDYRKLKDLNDKSYNKRRIRGTFYLFNDLVLLTIGNDPEHLKMYRLLHEFVFIANSPNVFYIKYYYKRKFRGIEFSSVENKNRMLLKFAELRDSYISNNCCLDMTELQNSNRMSQVDQNTSNNNNNNTNDDSNGGNSSLIILKKVEVFEKENYIIAREFFDANCANTSIPPMVDCSSAVIGQMVFFVVSGVFMTFDSKHKTMNINYETKNYPLLARLCVVNNRIFCFGGKKNSYAMEMCDQKFSRVGKKLDERYYHTMVTYQNSLVIYGGINKKNRAAEPDIAFFNINEKVWKPINVEIDLHPEARFGHSAVVFKNIMIIHGGRSANNPQKVLDDTWAYNFLDNKWRYLNLKYDSPHCIGIVPRCNHSAVVVNRYMFVIGGISLLNTSLSSSLLATSKKEKKQKNDSKDDNDENIEESSGKEDILNMASKKSTTRPCIPPSCFLVNLESWDCYDYEITGNFINGYNRFSAAFISGCKEIVCCGGVDGSETECISSLTLLELSDHYTSMKTRPRTGVIQFSNDLVMVKKKKYKRNSMAADEKPQKNFNKVNFNENEIDGTKGSGLKSKSDNSFVVSQAKHPGKKD